MCQPLEASYKINRTNLSASRTKEWFLCTLTCSRGISFSSRPLSCLALFLPIEVCIKEKGQPLSKEPRSCAQEYKTVGREKCGPAAHSRLRQQTWTGEGGRHVHNDTNISELSAASCLHLSLAPQSRSPKVTPGSVEFRDNSERNHNLF